MCLYTIAESLQPPCVGRALTISQGWVTKGYQQGTNRVPTFYMDPDICDTISCDWLRHCNAWSMPNLCIAVSNSNPVISTIRQTTVNWNVVIMFLTQYCVNQSQHWVAKYTEAG